MTKKRFSTNGYYIFDHFNENEWLFNEVDAEEIVDKMNNLDTKARENSKALSTLQKKLNKLHDEKEILFDAVKKADDLINRFGSDELKHEWKKEVTVKYR